MIELFDIRGKDELIIGELVFEDDNNIILTNVLSVFIMNNEELDEVEYIMSPNYSFVINSTSDEYKLKKFSIKLRNDNIGVELESLYLNYLDDIQREEQMLIIGAME
jgi:hypothetical protein